MTCSCLVTVIPKVLLLLLLLFYLLIIFFITPEGFTTMVANEGLEKA